MHRYMCIYVLIYVHTCIFIGICIYIYIYICIYTCKPVWKYMYIYVKKQIAPVMSHKGGKINPGGWGLGLAFEGETPLGHVSKTENRPSGVSPQTNRETVNRG